MAIAVALRLGEWKREECQPVGIAARANFAVPMQMYFLPADKSQWQLSIWFWSLRSTFVMNGLLETSLLASARKVGKL